MFKKKPKSEPRHFTHGTSASMADTASDGAPRQDDRQSDPPHAQLAQPLGKHETPDQMAEKEAVVGDRKEAMLDEGIEESFPASDPVSAHHIT